jgi:hypothetical protein
LSKLSNQFQGSDVTLYGKLLNDNIPNEANIDNRKNQYLNSKILGQSELAAASEQPQCNENNVYSHPNDF